jgi:hypothetical protein
MQQQKGVNLHKPVQSQVLHENEKVVGAMPPSSAKLNPRWVETLMGLPIGWVMPSCVNPITPIAEPSQSNGENWATPEAQNSTGYQVSNGKKILRLGSQVIQANWATPNTLDHMEQRSEEALIRQAQTSRAGRSKPSNLREQVNPNAVRIYSITTSTQPVTTAQTNSDSSATELFRQPQNSPLELFGQNLTKPISEQINK